MNYILVAGHRTVSWYVLDNTYKTIGDIKHVKSLSFTKQLEDYYLFAKQNGYTFVLKIKHETQLSKQSKDLIDAGEIIVEFITKGYNRKGGYVYYLY